MELVRRPYVREPLVNQLADNDNSHNFTTVIPIIQVG